MTKLDWEKASRPRRRQRPGKATGQLRQQAMRQFVWKNSLSCFVCKQGLDGPNLWAKTGISKRGPWAICSGCVDKRT